VVAVDVRENERKAIVHVDEDQLSLAIGKRGQNVRLAAKLTGWRIDVVKTGEAETVEGSSDEDTKHDKAEAPEQQPKEPPKKETSDDTSTEEPKPTEEQ
jgi:transcription termination/antitermination protein NusA